MANNNPRGILYVEIDETLKEKLKQLAAADDRSMSSYVRITLEEHARNAGSDPQITS